MNCKFTLEADLVGIMATMSKVCWAKGSLRRFRMADIAKMMTDGTAAQACYAGILESFRHTDIDLFLTTQDPNEALKAIITVHDIIRDALGSKKINIVRTEHAVTFKLPWPFRNIQVVNRLYRSAQHVLTGFDLDCCCFAYDGTNLISLPRAEASLRDRCNLVDEARQSTSFESRLLKYSKRGFDIAVPGAPVSRIINELTEEYGGSGWKYANFTGLKLLICMLDSLAMGRWGMKYKFSVHVSDYGENAAGYALIRQIKRARIHRKLVPFVCGEDLAVVLNSNIAFIQDKVRGSVTSARAPFRRPFRFGSSLRTNRAGKDCSQGLSIQ